MTLLGANTVEAIESATQHFLERPDVYCKAPEPGIVCKWVPAGIALTPRLGVEVNGRTVLIAPGDTLGHALQAAGAKPAEVAGRLTVERPFAGRLIPVHSDPPGSGLLPLVLIGGERIHFD
jgi:hypothetical protein